MKRVLVVLVSLCFLTSGIYSIKVNPIAGFNMSKYSISDPSTDTLFLFKPAWQIGAEMSFFLKKGLIVTPGMLFSFRGSRVDTKYSSEVSISGNYQMTALAMPLLIKYEIGTKSRIYLLAGAELVWIFSHQLKLDGEDAFKLMEKTRSVGWGAEIGLGIPFSMANFPMFMELRYSHGLSNIMKEGSSTLTLNAIQFILGFGLRKK